MLFFQPVVVEDGGLNGAPAPTPLPIWQQQVIDKATIPTPTPLPVTTGSGVTATIPTRTLAPPTTANDAGGGWIQNPPDFSGGVTINPAPPPDANNGASGSVVNDSRTTPTALNPLTGQPQPAPTTAVLQARPTAVATATTFKLTRDEIVALAILAALVIL